MTLHSARSRLAQLRNKLHAELSALKSSSTKHKKTEGRLGGVMDCIQILDEEMLAGEQGPAQRMVCHAERGIVHKIESIHGSLTGGGAWEQERGEPTELRPDQVAWLNRVHQ